jgi:hypothetical protein
MNYLTTTKSLGKRAVVYVVDGKEVASFPASLNKSIPALEEVEQLVGMEQEESVTIESSIKAGNKQLACELALIKSIEQDNGQVYLPNAYALVQRDITPRQWAGYLAALEKAGKYASYGDDYFGRVIVK